MSAFNKTRKDIRLWQEKNPDKVLSNFFDFQAEILSKHSGKTEEEVKAFLETALGNVEWCEHRALGDVEWHSERDAGSCALVWRLDDMVWHFDDVAWRLDDATPSCYQILAGGVLARNSPCGPERASIDSRHFMAPHPCFRPCHRELLS